MNTHTKKYRTYAGLGALVVLGISYAYFTSSITLRGQLVPTDVQSESVNHQASPPMSDSTTFVMNENSDTSQHKESCEQVAEKGREACRISNEMDIKTCNDEEARCKSKCSWWTLGCEIQCTAEGQTCREHISKFFEGSPYSRCLKSIEAVYADCSIQEVTKKCEEAYSTGMAQCNAAYLSSVSICNAQGGVGDSSACIDDARSVFNECSQAMQWAKDSCTGIAGSPQKNTIGDMSIPLPVNE